MTVKTPGEICPASLVKRMRQRLLGVIGGVFHFVTSVFDGITHGVGGLVGSLGDAVASVFEVIARGLFTARRKGESGSGEENGEKTSQSVHGQSWFDVCCIISDEL
jgi:phage-related protein